MHMHHMARAWPEPIVQQPVAQCGATSCSWPPSQEPLQAGLLRLGSRAPRLVTGHPGASHHPGSAPLPRRGRHQFRGHRPEGTEAVREIAKDPYRLDFLGLDKEHSERGLEDALVANIVRFLTELGVGFLAVSSYATLPQRYGHSCPARKTSRGSRRRSSTTRPRTGRRRRAGEFHNFGRGRRTTGWRSPGSHHQRTEIPRQVSHSLSSRGGGALAPYASRTSSTRLPTNCEGTDHDHTGVAEVLVLRRGRRVKRCCRRLRHQTHREQRPERGRTPHHPRRLRHPHPRPQDGRAQPVHRRQPHTRRFAPRRRGRDDDARGVGRVLAGRTGQRVRPTR